jgi:hypothetical protein
MKKIQLFIGIIFISLGCNAQDLYLTFNPLKVGPGLYYNQTISDFNITTSIEYGKYQNKINVAEVELLKIGIGTEIQVQEGSNLGFVICKNYLWNMKQNIYTFNLMNVYEYSLEVVANISLNKQWRLLAAYDILNYEAKVGIGYTFKKY